MKTILRAGFLITAILIFAGCPGPDGGDHLSIGDRETITIGSETLTMIYANNEDVITFPAGTDDSGTGTITVRFWMAETEVTNALMAEVLQWAYENGRFSETVSDNNGLGVNIVKHGGQQLLDLSDENCRVVYDGSGGFSAESGYENNPVTNVTWYGAVMFCNWLTEIRDGNTDNVVYTDIEAFWEDDETTENIAKTGYRLPASHEWEYAARYRGVDTMNTVSGYTEPSFTHGNSASGATDDYLNTSACRAVAVYSGQVPSPSDEQTVKSLGVGSANALGLHDMSGNVFEWCSTEDEENRVFRGGAWDQVEVYLQVGYLLSVNPIIETGILGLRPCRTAD